MKPAPVRWNQPQLCCDCKQAASEGWQELKYSKGGAYLEKRCGPCAEEYYGTTVLKLADDVSRPKRDTGRTAADDAPVTVAPLLDMAG